MKDWRIPITQRKFAALSGPTFDAIVQKAGWIVRGMVYWSMASQIADIYVAIRTCLQEEER